MERVFILVWSVGAIIMGIIFVTASDAISDGHFERQDRFRERLGLPPRKRGLIGSGTWQAVGGVAFTLIGIGMLIGVLTGHVP